MLKAREVPVEGGYGHEGGALGEAGRHRRGMMDGSHASHCEKIIVRCRQLKQCGSQPMPWENKDLEFLCVSECRSACGAPNLHIYMRRSRVNCSEFLRWVQSGGCCCFILHNKHTVSTHSSLLPRILNQRCEKVLGSCKSMVLMRQNSSTETNKLLLIAYCCYAVGGIIEISTIFKSSS